MKKLLQITPKAIRGLWNFIIAYCILKFKIRRAVLMIKRTRRIGTYSQYVEILLLHSCSKVNGQRVLSGIPLLKHYKNRIKRLILTQEDYEDFVIDTPSLTTKLSLGLIKDEPLVKAHSESYGIMGLGEYHIPSWQERSLAKIILAFNIHSEESYRATIKLASLSEEIRKDKLILKVELDVIKNEIYKLIYYQRLYQEEINKLKKTRKASRKETSSPKQTKNTKKSFSA